MSDYLTKPLYNGRGLENQLRNHLYSAHDLTCGCKHPKQHLINILQDKPCLHTTTETTIADHGAATGEPEEIDGDDLERLFAATDDAEG